MNNNITSTDSNTFTSSFPTSGICFYYHFLHFSLIPTLHTWNTELWPSGAQSFAFAVFATLICQINIVFPCKDTKAAKSCAFCDSLPVFCGTELSKKPEYTKLCAITYNLTRGKLRWTSCRWGGGQPETWVLGTFLNILYLVLPHIMLIIL